MSTLHTAQVALSPLVLYYCNETSGTTANDTSGNASGPYNLTIGSNVGINSSKLVPTDTTGGSFIFNNAAVSQASQVVHTGALPSYLMPTTAASVEAVVQYYVPSTGAGSFSLTSNGTIGLEQMMIGTLSGNTIAGTSVAFNLVYSTDGATAVQSNLHSTVGTTLTQHIVGTFTGGGTATPVQSIYVNGTLKQTTTLPSGALLFYPAANNNGPCMNNDSLLAISNQTMRMSNAAIYGFGLTSTQVRSNYSAFIGPGGANQTKRFNRFGGMRRF